MTNVFSPTAGWTTASRHVAATHGQLMLSNTAGQDIRWARTADDTAPAIAPSQGHLLRPGETLVIPSAPGDRFWLTASAPGRALIDALP